MKNYKYKEILNEQNKNSSEFDAIVNFVNAIIIESSMKSVFEKQHIFPFKLYLSDEAYKKYTAINSLYSYAVMVITAIKNRIPADIIKDGTDIADSISEIFPGYAELIKQYGVSICYSIENELAQSAIQALCKDIGNTHNHDVDVGRLIDVARKVEIALDEAKLPVIPQKFKNP